VTVPAEWLNRRRNQVAEASRKVRARKKQEKEMLKIENEQLKEERGSLLNKIAELQSAIDGFAAPGAVEMENQMLRTQLDQHKEFLREFLTTVDALEPTEESSKAELSKQSREFAIFHALRIIAESQKNQGEAWKRAKLPSCSLPGGCEFTNWYQRTDEGVLNMRMDFVLPHFDVTKAHEFTWTSWHDAERFQKVFGENLGFSSRELPEFSFKGEDGEVLTAYHTLEPCGSKFTETVYLVAYGKATMSKSTLALPRGRGPLLSLPLALDAITHHSKKKAKAVDSIDLGLSVGTTDVYYAIRAVTGHGLKGQPDDNVERNMSTAMEIVFFWPEVIESIDNPELAGPCTRTIQILAIPPDFKFEAIGKINDFVDEQGNMGARLYKAVATFGAIGSQTLTIDSKSDWKSTLTADSKEE